MPTSSKRVALVTGGSRGIGLGIAIVLADNGFDLAINGVREESDVADTLAALRERGAAVHYCRGDVAAASDRQQIVAAVRERFGRLDVLVNNAGVACLAAGRYSRRFGRKLRSRRWNQSQGTVFSHSARRPLDDRATASG